MLIVKGQNQKSVLASILMDKTNSICFGYYDIDDMPIIWNSICVNKTEYSLNDFLECISEEFAEVNVDKYYDYLIIYTNEKEEDLKEIVEWLENHRQQIFCRDILIMCKD